MTNLAKSISLETSPRRADTLLSFDHVSMSFGRGANKVEALLDISLTVAKGSFVSLIGPSGSGKTTLLNLTAGLLYPDNGTVSYEAAPITTVNTRVGYLTQDDALLPWRSVLANIALPLEIKGVPKQERLERARLLVEKVGLAGFERHRPSQLSGGMRKRVSLARTLIYRPETLLLDEPFGALDAQTRIIMQEQLLGLVSEFGLTVLLVTHDLDEAIALSDTIVVFSKRPATILEVVTNDRGKHHGSGGHRVRDDDLHARLWQTLAGQLDIAAVP
jgi:NitT/TauT family transport system ATP-binding protein